MCLLLLELNCDPVGYSCGSELPSALVHARESNVWLLDKVCAILHLVFTFCLLVFPPNLAALGGRVQGAASGLDAKL